MISAQQMRVRFTRGPMRVLVVAAILFLVPPVFCQTAVQEKPTNLEIGRKFLQAVYPELQGKRYEMCLSTFGDLDQEWTQIPYFEVEVGPWVESCRPAKSNPAFRNPPAGPPTLLGAGFGFDGNGSLSEFHAKSAHLLSGKRNEDIVKLVDAHQKWTDQQVVAALKAAGAKFGPNDREALLKILPIDVLEPFIGRFQVESSEFFLRHEQEPSSLAELYWQVNGTSTLPDGRRFHWTLDFEPFEGRLTFVMGDPRERKIGPS